jgi:hypothetical protein
MTTSLTPEPSDPFKRKQIVVTRINQALRDHFQRIGVAIVAFENGEPVELGSGTCVMIANRCFIATAAHVIDKYPNEALFLITSQERQDSTPLIIGRGSDPDADVAWLELEPGIDRVIDRNFISIERMCLGVSHLETDLAVVYGFPAEKARVHGAVPIRGLGVQPICFATHTLDAQEQPVGSDSDRDLFLAYPDEGLFGPDGPMAGIRAPGLSGGGIWTVEANTAGLWSPEHAKLIGIEHSWLPWKWVKGSQVQHFLRLMCRTVPELATVIRAVHPTI